MTARAWLPEPPCDICTSTRWPVSASHLATNCSLNSRYSSRVGSYDTFKIWTAPSSSPPEPPQAPSTTTLANNRLRIMVMVPAQRENVAYAFEACACGLVATADEQHGRRRLLFEQSLQIVDEVAATLRRGQSDHEQGLLVRGHEPLADGFGRAAAERLRANVEPMHAQRDVA